MKDFSEFIQNPSFFSKSLIKKLSKISNKYEKLITDKNWLKKSWNFIRISYWDSVYYQKYYIMLKNFNTNYDVKKSSFEDLKRLFLEFYENAILNNFLLYFSVINFTAKYTIITKEEEKNLMLKNLNHTNHSRFIDKYGHYALNRFEIKEKRFFDYTFNELRRLSEKMKHYKIPNHKRKIDETKLNNYNKADLYEYLREEFDYHALKFIAEFRKRGLAISPDYFDNNSF